MTTVLLLLPALGGIALALVATHTCVVVNADAVFYISAARELVAGRGLVVPWGESEPSPFVRWPPLFPAVLAGIDVLGPDAVTGARWLNAILFGITIALAGSIIRACTGSNCMAFCTGALVACSERMLHVHAMAGSEPLPLALGLGGFLLIARGSMCPGIWRLVVGAALLGLASLARFTGLPFAFAAAGSVLFDRGPLWDRVRRAGIVAFVAALPMLGWMGWNVWLGRAAVARSLTWDPDFLRGLPAGTYAVGTLFIPGGTANKLLNLLVTVAAIAAVAAATRHAHRSLRRSDAPGPDSLRARMCRILGLALIFYAAFFVYSRVFVDPAINLADVRHVAPVWLLGAILFLLTGYSVLSTVRSLVSAVSSPPVSRESQRAGPSSARIRCAPRDSPTGNGTSWADSPGLASPASQKPALIGFRLRRVVTLRLRNCSGTARPHGLETGVTGVLGQDTRMRRLVTATAVAGWCCLVVVMAPSALRRAVYMSSGSTSGTAQSFLAPLWRASPTMAAVKELPAEVAIYSNGPDAVYMLTGRNARWLPSRSVWAQASEGPAQATLESVRGELARGAMIVFLERLAWRESSPRAEDMERCLPLRAILRTNDGTVYGLAEGVRALPDAP